VVAQRRRQPSISHIQGACLMTTREIQRFWDSSIPEPNSGCFLWTKALTGTGYGQFRAGSLRDGTRRNVTASRYACELVHGAIPDGMQALHKCDNKICVNPDHLYIGTRSDNAKDAFARHRKIPHRLVGADNPRAKLSEDQIRTIRDSEERSADLARRYGLSKTQVGHIRSRKSWAHVS
jgi:hypothetical protein